MTRWPQARAEHTVDVHGHPVGVKVTGHRVKVEFDDAVGAAAALGRPVREVLAIAEAVGLATLRSTTTDASPSPTEVSSEVPSEVSSHVSSEESM